MGEESPLLLVVVSTGEESQILLVVALYLILIIRCHVYDNNSDVGVMLERSLGEEIEK